MTPNATAAKYSVSRNGGTEPLWSHRGGELFFRQGDGTLAAAQIATGPTPTVTSIRPLFSTFGYYIDSRHLGYAVAPDDQSFVFVKDPSLTAPPRVRIVTNVARLLATKVGK